MTLTDNGAPKPVWQPGNASLILFLANLTGSALSFGTNAYLARSLGAAEFGRYTFVIALLTFVSVFFDFGYFSAGARLLVLAEEDSDKQESVGAMCVVGGISSLLFIATVLAVSLVTDAIFSVRVGRILSIVAVLAPAVLAPFFLEQVLKGVGRVDLLGWWNVSSRLLFMAFVVLLAYMDRVSATTASLAYLFSGLSVLMLLGVPLKPQWKRIPFHLREIFLEHARFGRPLYAGRTVNLLSYKTDNLLLGFFRGPDTVGYYNLAMSIGNVIATFSQGVAAFEFRNFGRLRPIPHRVKRSNLAGILLLGVAALVGGYVLVFFYLGKEYAPVAYLLVPALMAGGFQSAYQPYNSWLLANGFGTDLKRLLYVVAGVNLIANLSLIPSAGAFGAAVASLIGMLTYLFLSVSHYRQRLVAP